MKYDWYKHHDERNERLKGCSGLLLQPVPAQKQAKRGMVKSSSENVQGKGDCFIPPFCTGDSVFHYSLHLRKQRAAWQREQLWNCELCSPWTLFPSANRQSCAVFWKEKKKLVSPQILLPLLHPLGGSPEWLIWLYIVYQIMKCTLELFKCSISRIRYKKLFPLA